MLRQMFNARFYSEMSKVNKNLLNVQHNKQDKLFFIEIPECSEAASLTYEHLNRSALDLQHTVVPEAFRGQGVGKLLAQAALDYVVENDLDMKLTCWYLQKYVKDNPKEEYLKRTIT